MSPALLAFAERLEDFDARLSRESRAELAVAARGRPLSELGAALRDAADPASIRAAAELLAANESGCPCSGAPVPGPTPCQFAEAAETLACAALAPFHNNPALRSRLADMAGPAVPVFAP